MIMCNNYNVYIRQILLGKPCVLAYTTAADYLGLSNGGLREYVEIFVEKYIDIPNESDLEKLASLNAYAFF